MDSSMPDGSQLDTPLGAGWRDASIPLSPTVVDRPMPVLDGSTMALINHLDRWGGNGRTVAASRSPAGKVPSATTSTVPDDRILER
jgi:hypothetical protein